MNMRIAGGFLCFSILLAGQGIPREEYKARRAELRKSLDGVMVFNPQGKPIGFIRLPERCPNLTFGGPKGNRLYMASSHSLYALYVEAHGAT